MNKKEDLFSPSKYNNNSNKGYSLKKEKGQLVSKYSSIHYSGGKSSYSENKTFYQKDKTDRKLNFG